MDDARLPLPEAPPEICETDLWDWRDSSSNPTKECDDLLSAGLVEPPPVARRAAPVEASVHFLGKGGSVVPDAWDGTGDGP